MRYSWLIAIKKVRGKKNNIVQSDKKNNIVLSEEREPLVTSIVDTNSEYVLYLSIKKYIFVTNDQWIIIKETITT